MGTPTWRTCGHQWAQGIAYVSASLHKLPITYACNFRLVEPCIGDREVVGEDSEGQAFMFIWMGRD